MKIYRIRSYEEYVLHKKKKEKEYIEFNKYQKQLLEKNKSFFFRRNKKKFTVEGFSYPAEKKVLLGVDYQFSNTKDINWRERLVCPITKLNNRMRASLHIFDIELMPYADDFIYITEQLTSIYHYLSHTYKNLTGSEYLGDRIAFGSNDHQNLRNEDLTELTFPSGYFDKVLSFDCLEHIPNYKKAFQECHRVLKKDGKMLWTVPFLRESNANLIRAKNTTNGEIEYLLEPEYHGDPVREEGCLCYHYFGWEMLDEIKSIGFQDAYAVLFWSDLFGYLGEEQIIFIAAK